jgi:hypothetical protein
MQIFWKAEVCYATVKKASPDFVKQLNALILDYYAFYYEK